MKIVSESDFVQSIANAFQWISSHHSPDFLNAMFHAWKKETHALAKNAMAQILENSKRAAVKNRPICQDTGIAVVFVEMGMHVRIDSEKSLQTLVNAGVRRAYLDKKNPLRLSVLKNPAGNRQNTLDNTPAVLHVEMVEGDTISIRCAAKGGGSEAKTRFAMLNPSDDWQAWVLSQIKTMGAGWCPPGIIGLGIGGTPEKAMFLAKKSLLYPVDMPELVKRGAKTEIEKWRIELFNKINALKIGAQGLCGDTTVLDVKILDFPTHAANFPIALMPNCAATRHCHFELKENGGVAEFFGEFPFQNNFFESKSFKNFKKLNTDFLKIEDLKHLKVGDWVLLNGKILTARDAAHKKLCDLLHQEKPLPIDLKNRVLYYVGPVAATDGEVVGPAGPTTATRMDKFTPLLLEKTGLKMMIGKAERGEIARQAMHRFGAVYAIAVGGAAVLVSESIQSARVLAFPELGMEAIYEFEVRDMPVMIAFDLKGENLYKF